MVNQNIGLRVYAIIEIQFYILFINNIPIPRAGFRKGLSRHTIHFRIVRQN